MVTDSNIARQLSLRASCRHRCGREGHNWHTTHCSTRWALAIVADTLHASAGGDTWPGRTCFGNTRSQSNSAHKHNVYNRSQSNEHTHRWHRVERRHATLARIQIDYFAMRRLAILVLELESITKALHVTVNNQSNRLTLLHFSRSPPASSCSEEAEKKLQALPSILSAELVWLFSSMEKLLWLVSPSVKAVRVLDEVDVTPALFKGSKWPRSLSLASPDPV